MSLDDDRIEEALARILERRGAGGSVSIEAVVAANPDLEAPLRARLRVFRMLDGLREPPGGAPAATGVFESLSSPGRTVHPLSLPDPTGEEPSPVVLPQTPSGRWGRYAVQGEIARGGIGVVLKARDPDLGRDVALKILREEHASSPDILQRFVEEAQVGGQLQHPGIVPVYELGIGSDGQPYFVMKLVKGKTLASLLSERHTPSIDRPRFVAVFQAVCQTVAYAHERRIVHRDLKPSNVMVGAFGEVQVLDWGMAKVLARGGAADDALHASEEPRSLVTTARSASGSAPSIVGSVFGTPQYMAPEQARGEVDRLDARADVFSLGAILCEILTGQPPYTGTPQEILSAAAQAHLGPARERLGSCGADAELVALATRCLSAERADRPHDAGALARDVTAHLASLEDRARRAEVAAGESRVLVAQERRARRLTLALSAAVTAFMLLGSGGWLWIDHQRRERTDAASRQAAQTLEEATRLRAKAEAAGAEDAPPLWREAFATARRAQALAGTDGADDATQQRVAAFVSEISDSKQRAEAAADQRRRDDATAERLDEIRALAGETWDWEATSAAYAAAFHEHLGGDVEALGLDEGARRIVASGIREQLVHALDFWEQARGRAGQDFAALRGLLTRVETNPWRAKLRGAKRDLEALRLLAAQADLDAMDVRDVLSLANRLDAAGDPDRAAALDLEAWRRHPGDFWACFACACDNGFASPPRHQEAIRFYTAALAVRPRSVAVHLNVGSLLQGRGETDGAIAEFREAIRLNPGFAMAHNLLGNALKSKGELDAAIVAYREAIRRDPRTGHVGLGSALGDQGDLEGEIQEFREAIRVNPTLEVAHYNLGAALLRKGDLDGAIAACRDAIRLDPKHAEPHVHLSGALSGKGDFDAALAECREALRLDPHLSRAHWQMGKLLQSRADLDGAITEFREAIRLDPRLPDVRSDLGIALGAKGDLEGATREFREAIRLDARSAVPHANLGNVLYTKGDWDGATLAYREAIRLDPRLAPPHVGLGNVLYKVHFAECDFEGAIEEYREAIRLDPDLALAHNGLGNALRGQGDRDGAIAEFRKALRLDPKLTGVHFNIGLVLHDGGDREGAIAEYREGIRLDPTSADGHFFLGDALRERGRLRDSLEAYKKAHELGAKLANWTRPTAQEIEKGERLIVIADGLPAFLRGETQPATAREALETASVGYSLASYVASSKAWARAFEVDPSLAGDLELSHRYNAACAAALAAGGKGTDAAALDAIGRARWLRQAIDWLRADLEALTREADDRYLRAVLEHWTKDSDLAAVRDAAELENASAPDREACRALWRDVAGNLADPPRAR